MLTFYERIVYLVRLPFIFILFLYQDVYTVIFGKKTDPNLRLDGRTAIVTGATRGIGKQIAWDLYQRGAKVIIASRKTVALEEVVREFCPNSTCPRLVARQVDLTSFKSVRDFVAKVLSTEDRLDILVNNAGIMGPKKKTFTEDGVEVTFQVNYLSAFLLTDSLLPLLNGTKDSRVVCVTSEYNLIPYYFDKDLFLATSKKYEALLNYSQSKLALNSFVIKLSEMLDGHGSPTINAVHPGCVKTELVSPSSALFYRISFYLQKKVRGVSLKRGADGPLYVATSPYLKQETGRYFVAGHVFKPNKLCLKKDFREDVWKFSQDLIMQNIV